MYKHVELEIGLGLCSITVMFDEPNTVKHLKLCFQHIMIYWKNFNYYLMKHFNPYSNVLSSLLTCIVFTYPNSIPIFSILVWLNPHHSLPIFSILVWLDPHHSLPIFSILVWLDPHLFMGFKYSVCFVTIL